MVVNIEQTVQSIRGAIEDAELMAGCEINSVYVGIAGGHIAGINSHGVIAVKGGEVGQRDVERALDAAVADGQPCALTADIAVPVLIIHIFSSPTISNASQSSSTMTFTGDFAP